MIAKVGYSGIEGAYAHEACLCFFKDELAEIKGHKDFLPCFEGLDKKVLDYIVIPIENSYAGRVAPVHNLIVSHNVYFNKEIILPIRHQLVALPGTKIEDIAEIYSHEQALWQCQKTLQKIFREALGNKITLKNYSNTATAAKFVSESNNKNIAAISSVVAANLYGLEVLKKNIHDSSENFTNFILMSNTQTEPVYTPSKNYVTSAIIEAHNKPGALVEILSPLKENRIDMYKIESYIPGAIKSANAKFFLSVASHTQSPDFVKALEKIKSEAKSIKILGCYSADPARNDGSGAVWQK